MKTSNFPHRRLIAASILNSLLGVSSMYYMSAVAVAQDDLQNFTNGSIFAHYGVILDKAALDWVWSGVVSALMLGGFFGGPLLNHLVVRFGSRDANLVWHNLLVLTTAALHLIALSTNTFELLIIARFIAGLALPLANWMGVFMTECSPVQYRGLMSGPTGTGKSIWVVAGVVLGLPGALGTPARLPYLMAVPAIPAIIHLGTIFWFPRSPKELYIREGNINGAIESIHFYYGADGNVEATLDEFQREAELSKSIHEVRLRDVFRARHLWMPFLLFIAISQGFIFGAGDIGSFYSAHVLERCGFQVDPRAVAVYCNIPSIFISILCLIGLWRLGRRPMILLSFCAGVTAPVSWLLAETLVPRAPGLSKFLGVIGLVAAICCSHISQMTVSILPGELCPLGTRSLSAASATSLSWLSSVTTTLVYLPVENLIGGLVFLPFALLDLLLLIFVAVSLPETKGLPVDQVLRRWISGKEEEQLELLGPVEHYGSMVF